MIKRVLYTKYKYTSAVFSLAVVIFSLALLFFPKIETTLAASQPCCTSYGPPPDDYCACGACSSCSGLTVCQAAPGTCDSNIYRTSAGICGPSTTCDAYGNCTTTYQGSWCERWIGCCTPPSGGPTPTPGGGGGGGGSCTQSGWVNQDCGGTAGATTCTPTQMLQTQTVSPAGCASTARCVTGYPACTGVPSSCDFSVNNVSLNGTGSSTTAQLYGVTLVGSTVNNVTFTSFNPAFATVTSPDTTAPYATTVTAAGIGNTSVLVRMTMNNAVFCQKPFNVTVNNPAGWFQIGSRITANGNINSDIPATCTGSGCQPVLIKDKPSGDPPGLAIARGGINTGAGTISSTNANVRGINLPPNNQDYDFFFRKINTPLYTAAPASCAGCTTDTIDQAAVNDFLANSAPVRGWHIVHLPCTTGTVHTGNFDMLNRRTILFLDCAQVDIEGDINYDDGDGGVIIITNGDVDVDPDVGGSCDPAIDPSIEALIHTDGIFSTGHTPDPVGQPEKQLHLKGSVVADAINLERDLGDNSLDPGECFEEAPDQIVQFPSFMSARSIIWREVAP